MYGLIKTIQIWWLLMKNKRQNFFQIPQAWLKMVSSLGETTYILFLSFSSCQLKHKCWPKNTKSLFALPSGRDRLENTNHHNVLLPSSPFFLIFFPFFLIYKKSSTNHKLVHTNSYMHFLFWGRIKRHCFKRGVRVPLGDTGSVTFLILVLPFTPPYFLLLFNWRNLRLCILKTIQTQEKSKSLRFMYLLKAMLSNWRVSLSLKA